jgi:hypothetical protein
MWPLGTQRRMEGTIKDLRGVGSECGRNCFRPEDEGSMFFRNACIYTHGFIAQKTNIESFTAMRN